MEEKNEVVNESFSYTYSAKQQQEIKAIREKYIPAEDDKMEQLRRLDASATKPGRVAALTLGIIGTLLLGIGMCCCMVWGESLVVFVVGIVVGVVGIIGISLAYPMYTRMTKKQRERIAPEVLKLTEELMK